MLLILLEIFSQIFQHVNFKSFFILISNLMLEMFLVVFDGFVLNLFKTF